VDVHTLRRLISDSSLFFKQPISRIIEALGWEWADIDPERTNLSQWGF
jgi:hypothetical protein